MSESLAKLTELTKDMCKVLDIDVTVVGTIDEKLNKATSLIKDAQDSLQVATKVSVAKDEAATALSTAKDEEATAVSTAKDEAATAISAAKDEAATAASKASDEAATAAIIISDGAKDKIIAQLTEDLNASDDRAERRRRRSI